MKLKTKVGPKGQIVIPKPIREKLGVKPDDIVLLDIERERLVVEKVIEDPLKAIFEFSQKFGRKSSEIVRGDELYEEVFGDKYGVPRHKRVRASTSRKR